MDPHTCIFAVLGTHGNGRFTFLGTGSFIEDGSIFLTAHHVVRDWKHALAVVGEHDISATYAATVVALDAACDLALLSVPGYRPAQALRLDRSERFLLNRQVVTFEFGPTRVQGQTVDLSAATRVGNITRLLNMTGEFGAAGETALELSFPALKGASGAPVLWNESLTVCGVLVANASYELLPAQIASVLTDDNTLYEEVKYLLPQGIAVHAKHAVRLFDRHAAGQ